MLDAGWVQLVREWAKDWKAGRRDLLNEVNAITAMDPRILAELYVEPDVQPTNPANVETEDDIDKVDLLFRIPVWRWLHDFLEEPPQRRDGRHVAFILSDAGMGKSSLLAMLLLSAASGVWPKIDLKLFKLGRSTLGDIAKLNNPVDTVLLLDSLDEDPEAHGRIDERVEEILKAAAQFRQVIITCRTQFFPVILERSGDRVKLGGFKCKSVYLSLFSERQVDTYLEKVFAKRGHEQTRAKALLGKMQSLRMRPMLLAYIEDLLEHEDDGKEWNAFTVYDALVTEWLDREKRKPSCSFEIEELRRASHAMAVHLQKVGGRTVTPEAIEVIFSASGASESILNVEEFGGRSLLNLNSDGEYRFAHLSIQEFLIVDYMARYPKEMGEYTAEIRYTDELVRFLRAWSLEAPKGWQADFRSADLRGVNLIGANLSGARMLDADLGAANLGTADLSDADLIGANFRRADLHDTNLTRANLVGTDLVGANLSGANLTGADLTGANLKGADLSDATLSDAVLKKASLVDALLVSALLSRADVSGADFASTNLHKANLTFALNLTQAQISSAHGNVKVPEELHRPELWRGR